LPSGYKCRYKYFLINNSILKNVYFAHVLVSLSLSLVTLYGRIGNGDALKIM